MESFVLMCGWARPPKPALRRLRPNKDADDVTCGDAAADDPNTTAPVQIHLGEIIRKIL